MSLSFNPDRPLPNPFQEAPRRRHPELGVVHVLGRTVDRPGEWTVRNEADERCSVLELELLAAPPA